MSTPATTEPISVVIADDQWMVREGLASLADLDDGVKVVGTASDGAEAVELVERLRPRVVLMDIRMPVMDGIAATAHITARFPGTHVLMLTTFVEQALVDEALAAGWTGSLTATADSVILPITTGDQSANYTVSATDDICIVDLYGADPPGDGNPAPIEFCGHRATLAFTPTFDLVVPVVVFNRTGTPAKVRIERAD